MIIQKFNFVLYGANYYGTMASSCRIHNLFEPLTKLNNIQISNYLVNDMETNKDSNSESVRVQNFNYNLKNPFSLIRFQILTFRFIFNIKKKDSINVFYCYGYPAIDNIFMLLIAKLLGYKIIFDIVENLNVIAEIKLRSRKSQLKNYTIKKLQRLIPHLADLCFANSETLVSFLNKLSKGKIVTLLLPISVDVSKISSLSKNRLDKNIQVFYGGSFGHKDGIDILIKGFEEVCKHASDLELILTGKGNKIDTHKLLTLISNSQNQDKIKYLGCLPIDSYFQALVNADILCMTRINTEYANAGFPYKLGEYLASGNAIIATDVSDISKYLVNNESAIIIEPDSFMKISDAILLLYQNKDLRIKCGLNGKRIADEKFDNIKVSNILLKSIKHLT